ncbi:glycoside hydrolase family 2 protein [Flammeovirga agarivorans]|uniref:Glycoside hydrolase family 2 n=1 Tax=Flammeovirga agarivorans TaxID=2726742 RepID=A0A7X8SKC4_9BACT|nr:glycoside hydrolase family 2 TIM barrel-domain containing protein [Flammeovirga agarivorans]NLR91718.1 glycoside hydrolase family 2 [Flammeovirga agarivorans]
MKKNFLLGLFMIMASVSFAQKPKKLTTGQFGERKPQDVSTIPVTKAKSIDKDYRVGPFIKTQPLTTDENEIILQEGWKLQAEEELKYTGFQISETSYEDNSWYNATVPGTVLTTLVNEKVYPDPYFGVNNTLIPDDLSRKNWWYRTEFKVPADKTEDKTYIVLNGINYSANVWLNGHKIGQLKGAFVRGKFEVSDFIKKGDNNALAIQILPPPNPGIPQEAHLEDRGRNGGQLCLDGPTFISSEGWDWIPGIRDRNIGVWQDVRVRFENGLNIANPFVVTDLDLPDLTKAHINISTTVNNTTSKVISAEVEAKIEKVIVKKTVRVAPNSSTEVTFDPSEYKKLNFKNPRLWWPNGYGAQELYTLELSVSKDGKVSDKKNVRFGIRELSFGLTVDTKDQQNVRIDYNPIADKSETHFLDNREPRKELQGVFVPKLAEGFDIKDFDQGEDTHLNPYLVIKVNGTPIFIKGGNWGMDDGMKRAERERLEPYLQLHKDANFNLIRNWTGESTEEIFYELCDEYGMLVWNDFWLSTQNYNLVPNDYNLFMDNAKDVVLRYRNHPSIVIWCPRNEGYAPDYLDTELSTLVTKYDGTRFYQGNSRNLNLRNSGPWHYAPDQTFYTAKSAYGFSTELGTTSVPTAETMRKMMAEEDLWPINDVWAYHDFHWGQEKYVAHIDELYGEATGIDDFCRKAQFVNYNSHRAMFESWNSKLWNNTTGLLLWMTHPAWPSTVWQVYSYDYETFGSYFASKVACEPLHIQKNIESGYIEVINASSNDLEKATASVEVFDLEGKQVSTVSKEVSLASNSMQTLIEKNFSKDIKGVHMVRLSLKDKKGKMISVNEYWETEEGGNFQKINDLEKISVAVAEVSEDADYKYFEISNTSSTPALNVKLNALSASTDKVILPAYFSEGYFTLMPNEKRVVKLNKANISETIKVRVTGYNIKKNNVSPVF